MTLAWKGGTVPMKLALSLSLLPGLWFICTVIMGSCARARGASSSLAGGPVVARVDSVEDSLARALAVEDWLSKPSTELPPSHWEVRSESQLVGSEPLTQLAAGSAKHVAVAKVLFRRATNGSSSSSKADSEEAATVLVKSGDAASGQVHLELLYLEFLRGRVGVPRLHGGWVDEEGARLYYVVDHSGRTIGHGGTGGLLNPARLSAKYTKLVREDPLGVALALVRCFASFTEAGFLLYDFKPEQFTVKRERGRAAIYLVDGPNLVAGPLAEALEAKHGDLAGRRTGFGASPSKFDDVVFLNGTTTTKLPLSVAKSPNHHEISDDFAGKAAASTTTTTTTRKWWQQRSQCVSTADCGSSTLYRCCCVRRKKTTMPVSLCQHTQKAKEVCSAAEETTPDRQRCESFSPATHVGDLAGHSWLFPFIIRHAREPARTILAALQRDMLQHDPLKRPTLIHMAAALEKIIIR